jgi:hypothetical protein
MPTLDPARALSCRARHTNGTVREHASQQGQATPSLLNLKPRLCKPPITSGGRVIARSREQNGDRQISNPLRRRGLLHLLPRNSRHNATAALFLALQPVPAATRSATAAATVPVPRRRGELTREQGRALM